MLSGSLIIEGTSDPFGRFWTANLIRVGINGDLKYEGLVFSNNLRFGFDPANLQPVLPKNLIHQIGFSTNISKFMDAWKGVAAKQLVTKIFPLGNGTSRQEKTSLTLVIKLI